MSENINDLIYSGHTQIGKAELGTDWHWHPMPVCPLQPTSSCWGVKSLAVQFRSITQSCPTLQLHGLQHARLPYPSLTPGVCSNSCPSGQGCHPTISSSVIAFSSCLQTFPASGSFPMSQFFASGGPSIGVSTSASILPMNIQD